MRPVFRDREELSAGRDLGESIRTALQQSESLIVVCSPAAAESRWVNLEIEQFRNLRGADNILCIVAAGEPFASNHPDATDRECFPPALQYTGDDAVYEPIAADIRKGGDGRRLAKLKIISGLVGVGLDELVQRDTQRRHRRMLGLSLGSFAGMIVMAVLSFLAVDARNEEQLRRAEAEDLIEFMLGDLRDRLDAVGRLDVLDSVGEKAIEYYSSADPDEHSDAALGRRARAFHLLGEVDDLRGNIEAARSAFEEAFNSTGELVRRSPNDAQLIYNHAQSVFWVGFLDWRLGNLADAENAFSEYLSLANRLDELEPGNATWLIESANANLNLGVYSLETSLPSSAIPYFLAALEVYQRVIEVDAERQDLQWEIAQAHAWLADAYESDRSLANSREEREIEAGIYRTILQDDPDNQDIRLSLMSSLIAEADLVMQMGDIRLAREKLDEARRLSAELRSLDPENTLTLEQSASILADLAEAAWYEGDVNDALMLFDETEILVAQLFQRDSTVLDWQILSFTVQLQRSNVLLDDMTVDPGTRLTSLQSITDGLNELITRSPESVEVHHLMAGAQFQIGEAYRLSGSPEEATIQAGLAIERLSGREAELPPRVLALLGRAHRQYGNTDRADEIDAELKSIGFRHPEHPSLSSTDAN